MVVIYLLYIDLQREILFSVFSFLHIIGRDMHKEDINQINVDEKESLIEKVKEEKYFSTRMRESPQKTM